MESERASEADEVFTSEVPATHSQATKPAIKADVDTIRTHLQSYWGNTEFSDVKVELADGRKVDLHRIVLSQCEFFRLACTREFEEAETRTIRLPDDDPKAVEFLLLWLYGFNWKQCCGDSLPPHASLTLEICILADKYDVPKLQNIASKEFSWAVKRLLKDDRSLLFELLSKLFKGPEKLPARSRTLTMLKDNSDELLQDPSSARDLFIACPEIAADLIMHAGLGRGKKPAQKTPKSVIPAKRSAQDA